MTRGDIMRSLRSYRSQRKRSQTADIKKNIRRFAILMAVALVLFQIQSAGDPVEMYLRVVGDAASPAMNFSGSSIPTEKDGGDFLVDSQSGQIFLKTVPAQAGVRVWQDNVLIGDIPQGGKTFSVKPGRLLLDARGLGEGIRVEITYLGQKYLLEMTEEIKSFDANR